ncbi:MAG TPA: pyrroloquinoline quinone biosynthesis protein PqqB [Polyangiaceae bacterium]|nr:pyrroloquinoline quinone biosynthesis protein PqqB [Polyangiaceae bacterium]
MRIRILGSGAGGGVPQWNCGCENCRAVRTRQPGIEARTQDAIAVSAGNGGWVLCNCSPDVLRQIEAFDELHPRAPRHSPISAIVLTNGDLDHVLGLFSLRESYPLVIYATEGVRAGLFEQNAIARTLSRFEGHVTHRDLPLGAEVSIDDVRGEPTGVRVTARPVRGKIPVHLEGLAPSSPDQNVGLWLREGAGKVAAYVSAVADLSDVTPHLGGVDVLLLDGTFWSSDELSRGGLSKARAEDMAHLPIGDPAGSLEATSRLGVRRRIYTHINNTNPILVESSPERRAVTAAGWEVATDGMDVLL